MVDLKGVGVGERYEDIAERVRDASGIVAPFGFAVYYIQGYTTQDNGKADKREQCECAGAIQ